MFTCSDPGVHVRRFRCSRPRGPSVRVPAISAFTFARDPQEIYGYIEQRAAEARDLNKEFTRPIFGDAAIQQLVDVLQKRRSGDQRAEVQTVTGKVSYATKAFFNQFLDQLDVKKFVRTAITLPAADRKEFVNDVSKIASVSPERRQALLDVIRGVLPKVEGLRMKNALLDGLKKGDLSEFIDFQDVSDATGEEEG